MDTKKFIGVRVWNTRNNTRGTIRYIEDGYVAITRAKYSVCFVYKTKKSPSENIGIKWAPNIMC